MSLKRNSYITSLDEVCVGDPEGPHEHVKTVKIIETVTREIKVYSNEELDDEEVKQLVEDLYFEEELILDGSDDVEVEFE
jgi:hypothetical protein